MSLPAHVIAYFDESSTDLIYLIGGWTGEKSMWAEFSIDWMAELSRAPGLKYFSHNEAQASKGQFAGWSRSDIDEKLNSLADVICGHEVYGVINGLNLKTWAKAFEAKNLSRKLLKSVLKLTHPYHSCFHGTVSAVLQIQIMKGMIDAPVDFVFDEQRGLLKESIASYDSFKLGFPPPMQRIAGTVAGGDDKLLPPLQAADLLCGQIVTNLSLRRPQPPLQRLLTCHQVYNFRAYPPRFESIGAVVEALDAVMPEKIELDKLLAMLEGLDTSDDER